MKMQELNYKNFEDLHIPEEILKKMLDFQKFSDINQFIQDEQNAKYKMKILMLISEQVDKKEVINTFNLFFNMDRKEDFYRIIKISKENPENPSLFFGYLCFTENPYYYFLISFQNQSDIEKMFLKNFIFKQHEINLLWITHTLTFEFIDLIEKSKDGNLFEYRGLYIPTSTKKLKIRPLYERKLSYKGLDCSKYIKEQHEMYGISVESFSTRVLDGEFIFNRKLALLTTKKLPFSFIHEIIEWMIINTEKYLVEIRKFKQEMFHSQFIKREYFLSNNLNINFENKLSDEVLSEIKTLIESESEFEILNFKFNDSQGEPSYYYSLLNKDKKAIFDVVLTPEFGQIFHKLKSNYINVLSLLDIFDYCQPLYTITITEP